FLILVLLILDRTLALDHEIGRAPVKRHIELRVRHARTVNDRLVIAGEQPTRFAKLGDPHRAEILLEESARLVALERRARHPFADVLESKRNSARIAQLTLPVERLAARLEGRESGAMIVAGPAVEVRPLERLKLAIRDFQRIDGRVVTT